MFTKIDETFHSIESKAILKLKAIKHIEKLVNIFKELFPDLQIKEEIWAEKTVLTNKYLEIIINLDKVHIKAVDIYGIKHSRTWTEKKTPYGLIPEMRHKATHEKIYEMVDPWNYVEKYAAEYSLKTQTRCTLRYIKNDQIYEFETDNIDALENQYHELKKQNLEVNIIRQYKSGPDFYKLEKR